MEADVREGARRVEGLEARQQDLLHAVRDRAQAVMRTQTTLLAGQVDEVANLFANLRVSPGSVAVFGVPTDWADSRIKCKYGCSFSFCFFFGV
jgi:hypothetical protein